MIQYTITSETPAEGQATEGRFTTRHKKLQGTLCGTLQGGVLSGWGMFGSP